MVGFNYRRCPAVLEAKKLIDEGAIGDILGFRALYLQDWAMPEGTPWSWRFGANEAGSGALGDIGSHALDYALFLVGEIDSVSGATRNVRQLAPAERQADSPRLQGPLALNGARFERDGAGRRRRLQRSRCIRFKNGALGTLEASRFAWGHKNDLTFEISGTKGALAFSWERRNELHYYSAEDRSDVQGYRIIMCGPAQPSGELSGRSRGSAPPTIETQVLQVGTFVQCDRQGSSPPTPTSTRMPGAGCDGSDRRRSQERPLGAGDLSPAKSA